MPQLWSIVSHGLMRIRVENPFMHNKRARTSILLMFMKENISTYIGLLEIGVRAYVNDNIFVHICNFCLQMNDDWISNWFLEV